MLILKKYNKLKRNYYKLKKCKIKQIKKNKYVLSQLNFNLNISYKYTFKICTKKLKKY